MKGISVSRRAVGAILAVALATAAGGGDGSRAAGPYDRAWRLSYRIPRAWVSDPDTAVKLNLTTLLVPEGQTYRTADLLISVGFQEKRPGLPLPSTLEQFFMAEMGQLLRLFPDLQSESWRPESLDRTDFDYAGLEIFGEIPRSLRVVMIDAGDGFYSVHAQARNRADLDREDIEMFFDSLLMLPRRGRS